MSLNPVCRIGKFGRQYQPILRVPDEGRYHSMKIISPYAALERMEERKDV